MTRHSYSHEYNPPAPVIPVSLAKIDVAPVVGPKIARVDTGADGMFVPSLDIEEVGSFPIYLTTVYSPFGTSIDKVAVHKMDIILYGDIRLPGVEVVSDDWGETIILGRNVLNLLRVHLDGRDQYLRLLE